jgi:Uma2 family endonuclease
MSTAGLSRRALAAAYERYAREYCESLPLEHFMEATPQGTQRAITLESLALVHARRPDVQVFNELLVQYPQPRHRRPKQVVPDNLVVVWPEPLDPRGSYDVPLQPTGPFWVLEYVSRASKRKDYKDSFRKYEKELKVPYCLLFHPEQQDLRLYRHTGRKYELVPANEHERHPIPPLELEVALRDGWVRFWFRGKLLPLPAELQRDLDRTRRQLRQARRELEKEREARLALEREVEQLRSRQSPPPTPNGP